MVIYRQRTVDGIVVTAPSSRLEEAVEAVSTQVIRYEERFSPEIVQRMLNGVKFKPRFRQEPGHNYLVGYREYPLNGVPYESGLLLVTQQPSIPEAEYFWHTKTAHFSTKRIGNIPSDLAHEVGHAIHKTLSRQRSPICETLEGLYRTLCNDVIVPEIKRGRKPVFVADEIISGYSFTDDRGMGIADVICEPKLVVQVLWCKKVPYSSETDGITKYTDVEVLHRTGKEFFCEAFDHYMNRPQRLANRLPEAFKLMQQVERTL